MALHTHSKQKEQLGEIAAAAKALGAKPIPTPQTLPLSTIKRQAKAAIDDFDDAKQTLLDKFTVFELDNAGNPKEDARGRPIPAPVYAFNDDGTPKFKTDKDGDVIEPREREVRHGVLQLTNQVMYERELRALERETVEITVPHLSWTAVEAALKTCEANVIEPLFDFFDGLPDLSAPDADAERVAAKQQRRNGAGKPRELAAVGEIEAGEGADVNPARRRGR